MTPNSLRADRSSGQVRALYERLITEMGEVKGVVKELSARWHAAELEGVKNQTLMEARIAAAHSRLDEHATELDVLKETVKPVEGYGKEIESLKAATKLLPQLVTGYRVFMWIASILGVLMIGLVWSLLTGQASIIFQ